MLCEEVALLTAIETALRSDDSAFTVFEDHALELPPLGALFHNQVLGRIESTVQCATQPRSPSRLDFYEDQLPLGILDMADRTALHSEMSEIFAGGDVMNPPRDWRR